MTTLWSLTDGQTYHLLQRSCLDIPLPNLEGKSILITGGHGFIGCQLATMCEELGAVVSAVDLEEANVLDSDQLFEVFSRVLPHSVIHLAAHKYATSAEEIPATVADLNITGTENVSRLSELFSANLVLASTCKAVDPCTAYGASKLIAERVVLQRGQRAFRLVNVLGSTGSVLDIWNNTPEEEHLFYTDAKRYWISPNEACAYLLACIELSSGIYVPEVTSITMANPRELIHRYTKNNLRIKYMPLRRGDRKEERLIGEYERVEKTDMDCLMRVIGPWDA